VHGWYLIVQGVSAPLGVKLTCADPAPIACAPRAVHVIAAISLIGNDATLRAFLAVFLDDRSGGLFNCSMISHPVCARLAGMGVAVDKAVSTRCVGGAQMEA
jgi:hypothetical protein